jgi:hypothetical protein
MMGYALAHWAGIRRDGVGSPWHEQNWIGSLRYAGVQGMADTWKKAPVVFEWFGDFDYLKSRGWSFDAAVNFMLNNHVSVINDNFGRVPPKAMPQLEKLARLASYRFVLREVAHDKTVPSGAALDVPGRYFPPRRLVDFPLLYPYLLASQKAPPEWVASQALRNSWPRFSLVYPKAKPSRNSSPPKSAPATAAAQLSSNW